MPKVTMVESSGFDLHEADEWIPGTITSIGEAEDRGFGPGLKWLITLDGEDWETWAFSSQKLSKRSKLYGWLQGLAVDVKEGDEVDTDALVGRRVQVMFEQYDDEGVTREKVVKIRAEKKGKQDRNTSIAGKLKSVAAEDDDPERPF